MIRLNTHDAAVLARIAQYETLPMAQREEMLETLSPMAREVGRVLLHLSNPSSKEIEDTAEAITNWVGNNRKYRKDLATI
jgi:hypothetical protein